MRTPLCPARCPRSCTRPSLTSIIDVAPQPRRVRARRVVRMRPAVRGQQVRGLGQAGPEQGQAGRGMAEHARHGHHVPGPGPGPGDRGPALQVPQCGHRQHDQGRAREIAAGHAGADPGALVGQASRHVLGPGHGQIRGSREADQEGGGHRAHRRDVREVLRRGLAADLARGRPVPAEMPVLDQQIGAGDHAPVGGPEHRRVVADADQRARGRRETGGQRRDKPEFAQIRDGDGALPAAVFGFRVAWPFRPKAMRPPGRTHGPGLHPRADRSGKGR